ncbi:hypothetical protein [Yersinia hibernica]|uniref:Uncharacterized protein n=1 Tax=Yersinia enterocolitica LC20 TaxID=1443113 RepID=A0A7U4K045_YEREN|nr:hypothetical protein [Yersinia hibernica]AHM72315.1 hypothetical protein LC20_01059 [Yersinia hibernica]
MFRFTSASLRQVLTHSSGFHKTLTLENGYGLYLRGEDDRQQGYMHMAYAEGFDPRSDEGWEDRVVDLLPGIDYSFSFFIPQSVRNAILNDHHDFFITPLKNTVHNETRPPRKVFVPVAEFRNGIERMFDQSHKHFLACVGHREKAAWRLSALYVLDDVIRIDCKRAKAADREQFRRAFSRLKDRINTVSPEGEIILPV